jgi:hypothetical protein
MLEERDKGDQSRRAVKLKAAQKKKASADKKKRRKYRALDAEKNLDEAPMLEGHGPSTSNSTVFHKAVEGRASKIVQENELEADTGSSRD